MPGSFETSGKRDAALGVGLAAREARAAVAAEGVERDLEAGDVLRSSGFTIRTAIVPSPAGGGGAVPVSPECWARALPVVAIESRSAAISASGRERERGGRDGPTRAARDALPEQSSARTGFAAERRALGMRP